MGLLASWWCDLNDKSIDGRTFEVEDPTGDMETLTRIPTPSFVVKGTTTGVAVGLLVLDVIVLTVEVLEDSGSESCVDLLATNVVEVVTGSIEMLTRLPSLAVVTTTGEMVMPGTELEVLTIEVGSSRVFSIVSTPLVSTSFVDVTGGLGAMVLPEGSTVRTVVLSTVGPGGVTTTIFVEGVWVLVFIPTLFMSSASRETSMLVELLEVDVEVVDDEVVDDEVLEVEALRVVLSTTEACGPCAM